MAKDLSNHQRKIVNRYYEHQDTIRVERLSDLVTDLYLCESKAKAKTLWNRVRAVLVKSGVSEAVAEEVTTQQDLERLATLVKDIDSGRIRPV